MNALQQIIAHLDSNDPRPKPKLTDLISANPGKYIRPDVVERIAQGRPALVGITDVESDVWETLVALAIFYKGNEK